MRDGDACPQWPLRLPVVEPVWLGPLAVAAGVVAAACLGLSAAWLGAPAWLAAAAALLPAVVQWARRRAPSTRQAPRAAALRASLDPAGWSVLLDPGWHGARLRECRRGACWLSLSLELDGMAAASGAARTLVLTVWRPRLTPRAWRRLCLATGLGAVRVPVSGRSA